MSDLNLDVGIDLQGVQFRTTENDKLIVEISYAERRHQSPTLAKFEVLMFDSEEASQQVGDLIETLEDIVDLMLNKLTHPAASLPGRER